MSLSYVIKTLWLSIFGRAHETRATPTLSLDVHVVRPVVEAFTCFSSHCRL